RAFRSLPFASWQPARLGIISSQLLRFPSGVYFARDRRLPRRRLSFLAIPHHLHQPSFNLIGGFRWLQTESKGFAQRVTFRDRLLRLLSEFSPRFLKLGNFLCVQRTNHEEPSLVLKLLKVHR